jgi:hypothetical protein
MEGLVLTMTVEVPVKCFYGYQERGVLMSDAREYCDELWLDGQIVPWSGVGSLMPETPVHVFKYILKPGIDYIPARAFANAPSEMKIRSITLPEGLKTLKNSCFYRCHFTGNLILPDSLVRICADALDCTVDGVFRLPAKVKHISSLPVSERTKDEIILPEGMVSYTPERIITDHLHIPSTLKICHPRYYSHSWQVRSITLDPGNTNFIIKEDALVSLLDEKREKLKKMAELSWNAHLDTAFSGTGLEIRKQYDGKTLTVSLLDRECIYFRLGGTMTPARAEQAADIARRFKVLADGFPKEKAQLHFGRLYYVPRKRCLFFYAFNNDAVNIELSIEGGRDELMETFILSQKYFSLVTRQVKEIEKKYGRNHLRFSFI